MCLMVHSALKTEPSKCPDLLCVLHVYSNGGWIWLCVLVSIFKTQRHHAQSNPSDEISLVMSGGRDICVQLKSQRYEIMICTLSKMALNLSDNGKTTNIINYADIRVCEVC